MVDNLTIGTMNTPGKIKIMMGGQVVGLSDKPISITPANQTEAEPVIKPFGVSKAWEISAQAMIQEPGDMLRDILNEQKFDVTIGREIGKLPRKMKKALNSNRMTKWKRKVAAYISRRQIHLHDVAVEVTSAPPIRWEARRDSAISAYFNRRI